MTVSQHSKFIKNYERCYDLSMLFDCKIDEQHINSMFKNLLEDNHSYKMRDYARISCELDHAVFEDQMFKAFRELFYHTNDEKMRCFLNLKIESKTTFDVSKDTYPEFNPYSLMMLRHACWRMKIGSKKAYFISDDQSIFMDIADKLITVERILLTRKNAYFDNIDMNEILRRNVGRYIIMCST